MTPWDLMREVLQCGAIIILTGEAVRARGRMGMPRGLILVWCASTLAMGIAGAQRLGWLQ